MMHFSGINFGDTANGPGVRVSLFVSGCSLHCKGCFNQEAWDKDYGQPFNGRIRSTILEALRSPWIAGLSLLGGDPLEDYNEPEIRKLCMVVKAMHPDKTIWLWTGRKLEQIKDLPTMQYVDAVVCNPFIEHLKCKGKYYGSSNQRIYYASKRGGIAHWESAEDVEPIVQYLALESTDESEGAV